MISSFVEPSPSIVVTSVALTSRRLENYLDGVDLLLRRAQPFIVVTSVPLTSRRMADYLDGVDLLLLLW